MRRHLFRIPAVIGETHGPLCRKAEGWRLQDPAQVPHIIDAAAELRLGPRVVDPDQQSLSPARWRDLALPGNVCWPYLACPADDD